jgi:hypothetical protein
MVLRPFGSQFSLHRRVIKAYAGKVLGGNRACPRALRERRDTGAAGFCGPRKIFRSGHHLTNPPRVKLGHLGSPPCLDGPGPVSAT